MEEPITALTKEERDLQLAATYNNLRQTIPPQLANPVNQIGGQQADVIMMLAGIIDGTMRRYIDPEQHARYLESLFEHLKKVLLKKSEPPINDPSVVSESISIDAQREILLNWHRLSLGDLSIILESMAKSQAAVITAPDSPHEHFWLQLLRLTWAEKIDALDIIGESKVPMSVFRLTTLGRNLLPKFINERKLVVVNDDGKIERTTVVYQRKL